jgi:SAM-dependent methyltransferase
MDFVDRCLARQDPLTPPARLRVRVGCFASYIRVRRYRAVAEEFAGHLSRIGSLTPRSRMLDIGCGCGQMAVPLTSAIGAEGCYEGFDPDAEAIAWCRKQISPRFPHFRFESADLANTLYNPGGRVRAEDFRFPYPDDSFDLILLKSVFTHMPHTPMKHYLGEIRRMLRRDGRCIASFFLINEDARGYIQAGKSVYGFPYAGEGCFVIDPRIPDYVVAHDESILRETAKSFGLRVSDPIHYGAWCGRTNYVSFQDLVVFTRESDSDGSTV